MYLLKCTHSRCSYCKKFILSCVASAFFGGCVKLLLSESVAVVGCFGLTHVKTYIWLGYAICDCIYLEFVWFDWRFWFDCFGWWIDWLIDWLSEWVSEWVMGMFLHSFLPSFVHSFLHSFIHSFLRSILSYSLFDFFIPSLNACMYIFSVAGI